MIEDWFILSTSTAAIAYLITEHDGPFDSLISLRRVLRGVRNEQGICDPPLWNIVGRALCCAECSALWIAIALVGYTQGLDIILIAAVWFGAVWGQRLIGN